MKLIYTIILSFMLLGVSSSLKAQETLDVSTMKKSQILKLTYNQLTDLSLEDLMTLADKMGVSTDELLQQAIVSASRSEESLIDAPLGAAVLTGDQIRKAGVTSIPEALRLCPGVIVREQTPGVYDVHVRGFDAVDPNGMINWTSNMSTLIMINNRIVFNEYQGNISWELQQVTIDDIDRIEIIRGPAAALYGPNAVTGVINIFTKSPDRKSGLQIGTYSQAGNQNTVIAGASVAYNTTTPFSVRVSGQYETRDRYHEDYYLLGSQIFDENGNYQSLGRVGFVDKVYETGIHPVTGQVIPGYRNVVGGPIIDANYMAAQKNGWDYNTDERYPNPKNSIEKYGISAHLKYEKNDLNIDLLGGYNKATVLKAFTPNNYFALSCEPDDNAFSQLNISYKNLTVEIDNNFGKLETLGSGDILTNTYNVWNTDAIYNWQISKSFNLKPGISYRTAGYSSRLLGSTDWDYVNMVSVPKEGERRNSMLSAYLRGEFKLNKSRFILALRADKFEYPNTTTLSPQAIYTFKATEDLLLRASAGRAFRSPFMINLFTDFTVIYPGYTPAMPGITQSTTQTFYEITYTGTESIHKDQNGNSVKPNYELMNTDEIEIGARYKFNNAISIDAELYYQETNNIDVFSQVNRGYDESGVVAPPAIGQLTITKGISLIDTEVNPVMVGSTVSLSGQPFKNFDYNLFVTVQKTEIKDYYVNDAAGYIRNDTTINFKHEATPSYYGGFNLNYTLKTKWKFNMNGYYYGAQTLKMTTGAEQVVESVKANLLLNATISYYFKPEIGVFISAKNFATKASRQYAITDLIGATYLAGVNIDL